MDITRRRQIDPGAPFVDLLQPVLRAGAPVRELPSLPESRALARAELRTFHAGIKRFVNPHRYPVGLERSLHELKLRLVLEGRRCPAIDAEPGVTS